MLTKNTQKIFCLLLLCGISELQDNKYTMITERIRNIFVYDKNLHARKIFHKTVEMIHTRTHAHRYTHARTHTHAHARTHKHTRTHACTHTHTRTHTHIYMQFGKMTFQVLQNTESNTLPSELLIRIRKIINEKM